MKAKPTSRQQSALSVVTRTAKDYKEAKVFLESNLRAKLEEELATYHALVVDAVRRAYKAEPGQKTAKSLLMKAYGTTDWATINNMVKDVDLLESVKQPSIVVDAATQTVTVNWFEFSDGDYIDESCTFDWDQENENLSWAWDGPDKIESAYSEKAIQNFAFAIELNAAVRKAWLG